MQFLFNLLSCKKATILLLFLNAIVAIFIFNISSEITFPDTNSYWMLAESIAHGKFSSWYFLPDYYPETLRTPGYPLFLSLCQLISDSKLFPKIIQLLLYFSSIYICILLINNIYKSYLSINIFLVLLIPNIQIVYYTGYISAETLNVFFVVLTLYLSTLKENISNSLFLALSCYCAFIIRPAFLLFPIILFIYKLFRDKNNFKLHTLFITVYILLLVPFGLWNKANHGVFKITPLEGGAGVAHMGFWQQKLPDGYKERYYWNNSIGHDLTRPTLYTENELSKNVSIYENEWESILDNSRRYITKKDSVNLKKMAAYDPNVFPLYNSELTITRERELWKHTISNISKSPFYYLKTRFYHFVRFYITGINQKTINSSTTFIEYFKNIYPFVLTTCFIFGGMIIVLLNCISKKNRMPYIWILVLLFIYYGVIHVPFAIQSRYTIPIHLLILVTLSLLTSRKITSYLKPFSS